jgi:hypothetical protein
VCGQSGHLDSVATPRAVSEVLGEDYSICVGRPAYLADLTPTSEFRAFHHAGTALGRAIRSQLNLTNPGRFHLLLPAPIADAPAGSAGTAYLAAVETEVNLALPVARRDARQGRAALLVEGLREADADLDGARSGASALMNSLVDHARGRICPVGTSWVEVESGSPDGPEADGPIRSSRAR